MRAWPSQALFFLCDFRPAGRVNSGSQHDIPVIGVERSFHRIRRERREMNDGCPHCASESPILSSFSNFEAKLVRVETLP